MEIPLPFLKEARGAGDLAKSALSAVGVRQRKGCGCAKRQAAMNRAVSFVPAWKPEEWPEYPGMPEGWRLVKSAAPKAPGMEAVNLYERGDGSVKIWEIADGKYKRSHGFCAALRASADKAMADLCR